MTLGCLFMPAPALGQELLPTKVSVSPYLYLQSWGIYSHGQEQYLPTEGYKAMPSEVAFLMRRARAGLKINAWDRVSANVMLAFDQIGSSSSLATRGGSANTSQAVSLFDVQIQVQLIKDRPWLYATSGYFRPQMGRESMTSAWAVPSFEKTIAQNYLRRHLVNANGGRAAGVNLSGTWQASGKWGITYHSGLFSPAPYPSTGSVTIPTSPLAVGRVLLHLGDPEQKKHSLGHQIQFFKKRNGISMAVSGAMQGASPAFSRSTAVAVDLLANHGPWTLDGEWSWMNRQSQPDSAAFSFSHPSQSGHIRGSYLLSMDDQWLEISLTAAHARAPFDEEHAAQVSSFAARESTLDAGLNYYFHENKLMLMLHYVWQGGEQGSLPDGTEANEYFTQKGAGAIQRGNYLGIGLRAMLEGS
ncbi:MAG: OprO/OprP family phosphate-selective porin [Bacteroidia bacterium]|nr:OprO/OprP family phosphate-selective porin [Bacteroidia bacterium]